MNVLVLGSGGREHALVCKIAQSDEVEQVFCIPGNAGICQIAQCRQIPLSHFSEIERFIRENKIDLTVVGPEQPLVEGMVDYLQSAGHAVFGPNKAAAQMEGSKIFAKELMKKYHIPTAEFGVFDNYQAALDYLSAQPEGEIVIKADGLAAGKGSVVCFNLNEARKAVEQMMVHRQFADAGTKVVIEEFMRGQEASLFVLTDGKDYRVLPPAQDFKRALDGDRGKNTGGMGSYAPTPVLTTSMLNRALKEIVEPTLSALKSEGIEYKGLLYCGLMITNKGPKVVEFNCRFGDPETQVVLPLLENDLVELLAATVRGELSKTAVQFRKEYAVCIIAASGGYPGVYQKGKVITGLEQVPPEIFVFHAGTRQENRNIVTNGGRVLGITALDKDLKQAADKAYQGMAQIHFDGMHYRRDIAERGWKMLG